jgi:1-phosphofructokinase family hexose kinase
LIYTLTLNPAVDRLLFIDEFKRSSTQRLSRSVDTIGGKGTHVSVNLKLLGVESTALGVVLGETGNKIIRLLRDWGVDARFIQADLSGAESRTNYGIIESASHSYTILTERGPMLPKRITDDLQAQLHRLLRTGDILVLAGDASNVEDVTIYAQLARLATSRGIQVVMDASGPYLKEGLSSSPFLIKPNLEELCFIVGTKLDNEGQIKGGLEELGKYKIPIIAMTWGDQGAMVKYHDDTYRIEPTRVNALNTGGCGDAFLAGLLAGLEKNLSIAKILRNAAAVAAAAAESELTVGFDPRRAFELEKAIIVRKIN